MTTYSFDNSYTRPAGGNGNGGNTNALRMASPKQQETLNDICRKKRLEMVDLSQVSYQQAFELIGQYMKKEASLSQAQFDKIESTITLLQNAAVKIKTPTIEFLSKLTAGEKGTGSDFIRYLISLTKDIDMNESPTEEMIAYMVNMYYYPEANFEDYGIMIKIPVVDESLSKYDMKATAWRRPLPSEFAEQIRTVMTKKMCQEFLGKHRVGFNDFKRTRLSITQEQRIRYLESKLQDVRQYRKIEFSVDLYGNIEQQPLHLHREYNPNAYQPIDQAMLSNFSSEDADEYIQHLEIQQSIRYESAIDSKDATHEMLRKAKNDYEQSVMDLKAIDAFLYAVESASGCQSEEIHVVPYQDDKEMAGNKEADWFFDTLCLEAVRKHKVIKEYLCYVIENDYVTLTQLRRMAGNNEWLKAFIKDMTEKELGIKPLRTKTK